MNTFTQNLQNKLEAYHVLKHPYYQAWNEGKLSKDSLRLYARQYFQHVNAFPRYISATHSNCENIKFRQVLLENLNDEEKGEKHHPELWLRFGEGLGEERNRMLREEMLPQTKALVETFMNLSQASFEEGLGALYAYEQQVPRVAETKIRGLREFYGISDERSLEFFQVHLKADEYHSQAVADIVESLSPESQVKVERAAEEAAKALWNFLSGICEASPAMN